MRRIVIALAGFVAVTALFGGFELITGIPTQQPAEWLDGTPFESYLIPGVLLAAVVGGSAVAAVGMVLRRSPAWPSWTVASGAVLTGWITAEAVLLNQPSAPTPIEIGYFSIGIILIVAGWAARRSRAIPQPS